MTSDTDEFLTQCPRCRTVFRMHEAQLRIAGGLARCGSCRQIFPAPEHQLDADEPEDETGDLLHNAGDIEAQYESVGTKSPETLSERGVPPVLKTLVDEESLGRLSPRELSSLQTDPVTITRHATRKKSVTVLLVSCNILLLLALPVQYFLANPEKLMQQAGLEPVAELLCNYLDCPEPEQFDLSLLVTSDLLVQSHPDYDNALQVDFIFRNDAGFPQLFPLVELNFADINRRPLANRLFTPDEYLEEELQQFTHMPANSSLQVRLDIVDPGPDAVNYELALRAP